MWTTVRAIYVGRTHDNNKQQTTRLGNDDHASALRRSGFPLMTAGRQAISTKKDWFTPPEIIERVESFFGIIDLDPCGHPDALVRAGRVVTLPENGLDVDWSDYSTIYLNPPYGRSESAVIADWLAKAAASGSEVVALVPVATNTRFWQRFVYPSVSRICLLHEPRLRFWDTSGPIAKGAPMACCLLYWGDRGDAFDREFSAIGTCVKRSVPTEPDSSG